MILKQNLFRLGPPSSLMNNECRRQQQKSFSSFSPLMSLSASEASSSSSSSVDRIQEHQQNPIPVSNEPNLYYIPDDISPIYRSIPLTIQAGIWLVSSSIAATTTWLRQGGGGDGMFFNSSHKLLLWRKILWFVLKTFALAKLSTFTIQDLFYQPSRITTQGLIQNYFLPSKLSQYKQISIKKNNKIAHDDDDDDDNDDDDDESDTVLGVHYLEKVIDDNDNNNNNNHSSNNNYLFDVMYLNHGFGASSLSWLPAIQPLQDALHIPFVIGHDAPGFGFTQRKKNQLSAYTTKSSAAIGLKLLEEQMLKHQHKRLRNLQEGTDKTNSSSNSSSDSIDDEDKKSKAAITTTAKKQSVLLMGHSMGAITTLRMALGLGDALKKVVLVAPAVGLRPQTKTKQKMAQQKSDVSRFKKSVYFVRRKVSSVLSYMLPNTIVDIVASYTLRRVVGTRNFWKNALQKAAWGNPDRLLDSDVLRFQWPSIGKGWEKGLLMFARAQSIPIGENDYTDYELLEKVLQLPNTAVNIIVGTNDKIVSIDKLRQDFPSIPVIELDGLGHDPFEEDKQAFVQAVKSLYPADESGNGAGTA